MPTRTPRIPDAALSKIPGKAKYRMATQGAEVVVGGDHPTLVLPEARASKWGGECWLRVRHADADEIDRADKAAKASGKALKTAEKASLRAEKGKPVLDIPTPGKGRRHEIREGSLKWDVVYDSPAALPADGIERFQLEFPEGLTWHYQPALTAEEIAEGHERPEEIVGGYVAYWAQSGRYLDGSGEEVANYETGRFGDIKEPLWVDDSGQTLRWTQELVGSELRCYLPTEWLATAVYPVRLDPTFGYESVGGSSSSYTRSATGIFSPPSNGSVTSISMACSSGGFVFTAGIYANNSSYPGSLLGVSAGSDPTASVDWGVATIEAPVSITTAANYWLAATRSGASIRYDSVAGRYTCRDNATYVDGVLPDPWPSAVTVNTNYVYSIYATYTESGGGTTSSADSGNIAISGSSATGVQTHISSADSGTVAITGSVAVGIRSLVSLAAAASIAIAGFSAEGVYTPTGSTVSSAGPGAVAISGSPANGVQTHISSADPGTVVILGSDANAATGYASTADPVTIAITGAAATASRTYVATASPASIAIAGSPAFATKSGGSSTSSGISLIFGKVILHL